MNVFKGPIPPENLYDDEDEVVEDIKASPS